MIGKGVGRAGTLGALACAQLALPAARATGAVPSWQPPVPISAPGANLQAPQVAVDATGNASAVWLRVEGSLAVVQSATRPAGGLWQAPVDLSPSDQLASAPAIAAGGGEVLAAWVGPTGVRVAARSAHGAWRPAVDVSAVEHRDPHPALAVDGHGGAVVVWDHYSNPGHFPEYVVQAAARLANGSWQAPVVLSSVALWPHNPDVAVNPAGDAVAVWSHWADSLLGNNRGGVQAAVRPTGGSWQAAQPVSGFLTFGGTARVAIDPQRRATAVWTRLRPPMTGGQPGNPDGAFAATMPAGGAAWQPPVSLDDRGDVGASSPQVGLDAAGNAVAVWLGLGQVAGSVRRPGEAWQAPTSIGGGDSHGVQLAMAANGDAVTVWHERRPHPSSTVQASVLAPGGAWRAAVVSLPPALTSVPQVAVDPHGEAVAVWLGSDGTNTTVQAATLPATSPVTSGPPAAPSAVAPPPAAVPVIAGLRLVRIAFRAARSGSAVRATSRDRGSRVSYRVNVAARVRFTVKRVRSGRRAGGRCVTPSSRNRHGQRCDRLVAVSGSFTRSRPAGTDRFTFSGRVGGRTLAAGAYRLVATPTGAGRTGAARQAGFRIASAPR